MMTGQLSSAVGCYDNAGEFLSSVPTFAHYLRDLSYNIKNYKKAFYKFYQIEIESNKIQDIKKNLTQNEHIIRHLFIKVDQHAELPTKILKNESLK